MAYRIASGVLSLFVVVMAAHAFGAERWMTIPEPPAMPTANSSGLAPVDGIEMYYARFGAGSPVLFIHGGLGHADLWANQVADLAKDHEVIVADSRGHGRSTRDDRPYGYDLMADDYLALLDYLHVAKVALVGWSDGGIIGIDLAMRHPERLSVLVAQAANTNVDGLQPTLSTNDTFNGFIERMRADYQRLSPTPDQYDAFVDQIGKMWSSEPAWTDAQLAAIHVPTCILLGDHDEAITREHTEYIARTIPGARLVILPEASHFAMLQDPAGYDAAVRDCLASASFK